MHLRGTLASRAAHETIPGGQIPEGNIVGQLLPVPEDDLMYDIAQSKREAREKASKKSARKSAEKNSQNKRQRSNSDAGGKDAERTAEHTTKRSMKVSHEKGVTQIKTDQEFDDGAMDMGDVGRGDEDHEMGGV